MTHPDHVRIVRLSHSLLNISHHRGDGRRESVHRVEIILHILVVRLLGELADFPYGMTLAVAEVAHAREIVQLRRVIEPCEPFRFLLINTIFLLVVKLNKGNMPNTRHSVVRSRVRRTRLLRVVGQEEIKAYRSQHHQ